MSYKSEHVTMGTIAPDAGEFFNSTIKGNLTKITWAHAVNDNLKLNLTLADDSIMMVEADVVLGTIDDSSMDVVPIMAHPPKNTSNLSLESFLSAMVADGKRGVKLDFKSIEAFDVSLDILAENRPNMTFPVWLNADILSGPVDSMATPVDAKQFIEKANKAFPESTLSVGWTTRYGLLPLISSGNYTEAQIDEMIKTLSNVSQPVTFPIRAGLAVNDIELWSKLLNNTADKNSTLSIWSGIGDSVDIDGLIKLIQGIGYDKVYVDVPEDIRKQIDGSKASFTMCSFMLLSSVILANVLLSEIF
ncbi:protein FAM151B isoform X2 [Microplitis mediator]|uniref:protein FAM151B isoform X2 n=1 Tax=Microplitis mediator TaxID=375433 RepID=UPI002554BC05|nr:protein FAM151B isoform X2 [Microplitis mediator]